MSPCSTMAEALDTSGCRCSTNPSSSSSVCSFCAPSTCQSETLAGEGAVTRNRRTFRSLSLSRKKSKEKSEKSGKSKLSWTLRWRMKSPQPSKPRKPMIDLKRFNPDDYPIEDKDELARLERAREIAVGIEIEIESLPPSYRLQTDDEVEAKTSTKPSIEAAAAAAPPPEETVNVIQPDNPVPVSIIDGLTVLLHRSLAISFDSQMVWNVLTHVDINFLLGHFDWHQHHHGPQGMFTLTRRELDGAVGMFTLTPMAGDGATPTSYAAELEVEGYQSSTEFLRQAHTQVDYLHCLVPDLLDITKCSFYWGKMDRYEAERLLQDREDGTFLLRDSAQEEYLFSVSFRRYNRSLHARIEQWNHRFSFDSHDPGVYSSPTILGLIDHYKNPDLCMFFEPTLTLSLHRNSPFTLQHLCRSVVCSNITYDGVNTLSLPKALKLYLKEYHYKQRIRVRRLDG